MKKFRYNIQTRRCVISSVIIDGYNLIGIYHKDLEGQRKRLVEKLVGYKKIKGHDIIVVFDGWKSGSGKENIIVTGGVKVIYSRLGEKADSVIKRIITSEKRQWIVITSDRDIADYVWSYGSIAISSDEFLSVIEKSQMVTGDFELLEEDADISREKGNPGRLSRKEKAKRRALSKL